MKVVNVILSVLILLFAIASAVFSFFLFEKRTQLLSGWEKLAVAINTTAGTVDAESGSTYAPKLTKEELAHPNYAQLDTKLTELKKMTEQLIKERNDLADALYRIGSFSGVQGLGSKESLRKFDTYADNISKIANGVSDMNNKREAAIKRIAGELGRLGLRPNVNQLLNNDSNAMKQLSNDIGRVSGLKNDYEKSIRDIAGQSGTSGLNFGANYKNDLTKALNGARKFRETKEKLDRDLNTANNKIRNLENNVNNCNKEIAGLKQTVAKKDAQLSDLKIVLKIDPKDDMPMPWKAGSVESRLALSGKVLEVNKRYGYIGISVGKETRVLQQLGPSKSIEVNPEIAAGMQLKVYRGELDTQNPQYVATIKLDKVGEACSTADLPKGADIQVGDNICFEPIAE